MKDLSVFAAFAPKVKDTAVNSNEAVVYTRVSHSKQEDNTSLGSQKQYCERYAKDCTFQVVEQFGGTHESAKTDDRKEFNRMLTYVKRHRRVKYIIVYSYERFSRTGASGIKVAYDLMQEYNVCILSATQGIDPRTITGQFQQNMFLLMAYMENMQRRDKTITGMKECIVKGYIPYSIPRGYSNVNRGKAMEQKIVVNAEGRLLRKAFHWKVEKQMRNCEIIRELAKLGLKIDDRRLCEIFRNPLYCGILVSKLTPGEVHVGNHEPLISREMFLRANNIVTEARSHPVSHSLDDENLPLKRFMKCGKCGTPMTGFLVRKKGLFYYKCRVTGCKTSKSAKHVHEEFKALLETFVVSESEEQLIKEGIAAMYQPFFEEHTQTQRAYKSRLKELQEKVEAAEEQLVTREITRDLFDKYAGKYAAEIRKIEETLITQSRGISNLQKCLNLVVGFCQSPRKWWESANIGERMRLQNLIFPRGISFEPMTGKFQTNLVNAIFAPIPELARVPAGNKKGRSSFKTTPPSRVTSSGEISNLLIDSLDNILRNEKLLENEHV